MQWLNHLDSKACEHQYADTRQYREAFPVKVERCSYTILKPLQGLCRVLAQAKDWAVLCCSASTTLIRLIYFAIVNVICELCKFSEKFRNHNGKDQFSE